jgi:sphinganine-1-phosphate aldolase
MYILEYMDEGIMSHWKSFNESGIAKDDLFKTMDSYRGEDKDFKSGKIFNLVYYVSDEFDEMLQEANGKFFSENYLNPMAFKSLKQMEVEIIKMVAEMFNAGDEAVGTVTSGGTESILLACKTYKERAKKLKPWIRSPNMVVPESIHVAFEKASDYFGIKMITVPLTGDYRVDLNKFKKAINRNTIMVAASAPQYVQGVIDPIKEIGQIVQKKNIPFHVDACIGGFVLPWMEELGEKFPLFDFRVPGVTSISADLHKYGYTPKGASTLVYTDMSYMKYQFFISTKWPGGIYASPNIPGSRPGGVIAASWAAMKNLGREGYIELTKKVLEARDALANGIDAIDGVKVVARPDSTLIAYESDDENIGIYAIADQLEKKGWFADRHQKPESIHLTMMPTHLLIVDEYLADIKDAVAIVRANPELAKSGDAGMYGMMAKIPMKSLVRMSVQKVMEGMYGPKGEVPDLSKMGEGEDADIIFKLMNKYGDKTMDVLEKIEATKHKLIKNLPTSKK